MSGGQDFKGTWNFYGVWELSLDLDQLGMEISLKIASHKSPGIPFPSI